MTFLVASCTLLFVWAVAFPIGIYSALRQYKIGDYIITFLGFLGMATPNFLLALFVMYVSVVYMGYSVGGLFSPDFVNAPWSFARLFDFLHHLWIPVVVLGVAGIAALDPHHAGQSAGRAAQALCRDGPGQGPAGADPGAALSRPRGPQPLHQHRGLGASHVWSRAMSSSPRSSACRRPGRS